ncbi:MAG: bacillithiol biosynthesis BshC [Phycisphaerae bacterium]|nr:bacillithiol biosynthesis BshC [Gemmatimonadaceae bacterium]
MSEVAEGSSLTSPMPAVRTLQLGGGALSRALQGQSANAEWAAARPANVAEWKRAAHSVRQRHVDSRWLTALAPAFNATGDAASRLQRAAESGVVVTTGQQPGLFGGPTYTWSKAIAALALADELEQQLGIPVAPVFWAATDDADWQEAASTHVVGEHGLETLTLAGPPSEAIALAEVPLGDVSLPLSRLRASCGSAAYTDVLELIESAYVAHATVGASYVQLLRGILEPLGIAVLDASHAALRAAADPLLRRALTSAPAISDALKARGVAIRAAGFQPQVDDVDGLSLVFRTSRGDRGNVRERVPLSNAARVAREADIGTLGPNVLLRPVVERALLPTVAYLAGPGEFAYFAQISPVAETLGVNAPVAVPRWSGTILEPQTQRTLARLNVAVSDFDDPHAVDSKLAKASLDEDVADAFERVRVAAETQMRALQSAVQDADEIVPATVVEGAGRDILHRLDRLERRLIAGAKRRETTLMRDIAVARAAVRPLGQSPERVLNLVPALARYGPELLQLMRASARVHAAALVSGDAADSP